jgi:hypothetical protein
MCGDGQEPQRKARVSIGETSPLHSVTQIGQFLNASPPTRKRLPAGFLC